MHESTYRHIPAKTGGAKKRGNPAASGTEVKTLKQNINACKTRFKLSGASVTLVFDRDIISDDNAQMIKDVFENVKSFLKIRPFFVNTEKHVKAVYTICILACFLNKFLANQRKVVGEKDYLNSKELYL